MIDTQTIDRVCNAFYGALLKKSYLDAEIVYKEAIELSKDCDYRKVARRAIPRYESKAKKHLSSWQISLFMTPEIERLNEYVNAPANK